MSTRTLSSDAGEGRVMFVGHGDREPFAAITNGDNLSAHRCCPPGARRRPPGDRSATGAAGGAVVATAIRDQQIPLAAYLRP